jgi:radical SAM/Cys-rich protein
MLKPLKTRSHKLSDPAAQLKFLSNGIFGPQGMPPFAEKLKQSGDFPLKPAELEILQINLGYMCNQVCSHCHVDAGPHRKEIMDRATMEQILDVLRNTAVHTLDLTGGAPEMNPDFRWFVEEASKIGVKDFIVRSNLTIIRANKKYYDLPGFFRDHNIHVVSSLPFYRRERTDKQRGDGVFDKSIEALLQLNAVGYGQANSGLQLDLVYNPAGAFMPGDQQSLEAEFKKHLKEDFGILFNSLFTITNLPISRFLEYLVASDNYEDYMETLVSAYNPAAVKNVMCRNTISVSYDGYLYDCDFNQMLEMKIDHKRNHISQFSSEAIAKRSIKISQHCYGCTAGAGSSCQGSIA